jgi:hypothetical protein
MLQGVMLGRNLRMECSSAEQKLSKCLTLAVKKIKWIIRSAQGHAKIRSVNVVTVLKVKTLT